MIVEEPDLLRTWLTSVLTPLCDADPSALSKYVLALIKKDKPEKDLRQTMMEQLDVFLQSETPKFIENLFSTLTTKEYIGKGMEIEEKGIGTIEQGSGEEVDMSLDTVSQATLLNDINSQTPQSQSPPSQNQVRDESNKLDSTTLSSISQSSLSQNPGTFSSSPPPSSAFPSHSSGTKYSNSTRKEEEIGKDGNLRENRRKSRSPRRSRSRSRSRSRIGRRSRSPRDRYRERDRDRDRRHRMRKSPMRRYDRDCGWERRRSSRSPGGRNRSASPGGRVRSPPPPRYRRMYSSRSPSMSPPRPNKHPRRSSPPNNSMLIKGSDKSSSSKDSSSLPSTPGKLSTPISSQSQDGLDEDLTTSQSSSTVSDPQTMRSVRSVVVSATSSEKMSLDSTNSQTSTNSNKSNFQSPTSSSSSSMHAHHGNRCRDFDEKGLCMMGDMCPFDHGHDPVVLEDIVVQQGQLHHPSLQERLGNVGGDFGGRGLLGGPPLIPPHMRHHMPGLLLPYSEAELVNQNWNTPMHFRGRHMGIRRGILPRPIAYPLPPQRELISVPVQGGGNGGGGALGNEGVPSILGVPPMIGGGGVMRGMSGGRGGRGRFDHGRLGGKMKPNYLNSSLEVKKIPREQNTIMDLNSHFLRFGKIVNIQINYEGDAEGALITFSNPVEAQNAYRCTDAVLNNRFIRVFWHNKEKENEVENGGVAGAKIGVKGIEEGEKILVSGNSLTKTVYNLSLLNKKPVAESSEKVQAIEAIKKSQESLAASESLKKEAEKKKTETLKLKGDLQKRKQNMLTEQIENQKKLIGKLEANRTTMKVEEKDELMVLIKSLQVSIENLKKGMDESAAGAGRQQQQNQGRPPAVPKQQLPPHNLRSKEEAQKEVLDAELELYQKEQEGGDTVALEKKVQELRAQAKALGYLPRGGGKGPYRGLGRGSFTGRGGGRGRIRSLRTVDRRPTKIKITGFPPAKLVDVLTQFAEYGQMSNHEKDLGVPHIIINYKSRKSAETAMLKGRNLLKLTVQWVNKDGTLLAEKTGGEVSKNGEGVGDEIDLDGEGDEDEMTDILEREILFQYEEDEEEDEDRSWRR